MTNPLQVNRRRVLELSTVGTGLAIAGCADQLDANEFEGDHGDLGDDERRVTMQIEFEQPQLEEQLREFQQLQQQLQQLSFQAGDEDVEDEIAELEAELEELQEEITEAAFENVLEEFEQFNLTIEDRLTEQGLMKVAGDVTELVDATTETVSVRSLASVSLFDETERALEQQPEEPVAPQ